MHIFFSFLTLVLFFFSTKQLSKKNPKRVGSWIVAGVGGACLIKHTNQLYALYNCPVLQKSKFSTDKLICHELFRIRFVFASPQLCSHIHAHPSQLYKENKKHNISTKPQIVSTEESRDVKSKVTHSDPPKNIQMLFAPHSSQPKPNIHTHTRMHNAQHLFLCSSLVSMFTL